MHTVSARAFNQDVSAAKRHARRAPLMITDRGRPAFVLLSVGEYRRLVGSQSLTESLHLPEEVDFTPGRLDDHPRAIEL